MKTTIPIYQDFELEFIFEGITRLEKLSEWTERAFFARLLLGTGIRINEARNIRLGDCEERWIVVQVAKRGPNGPPKPRMVEPSPEFVGHYHQYVARVRAANANPETPIFPGAKMLKRHGRFHLREPRSVRSCRNWWREVINECGVRYLPPHAARRTYATHECRDGRLPLMDLKDQLGHSSLKVTEQHYLKSIAGSRYQKPSGEWRVLATMQV